MKSLKTVMVCMMFLMSANIGNAQNVTEVVDSVKSGLKSKSVKEAVSKVQDAFKAKVAEADSLIGTWAYVEPAVLSTSGNLLRKAIGNVSAGQLEKLMRTYSEKCGFNSENTEFTFRENGTFARNLAGRKAEGVWMVNGDNLLLALHNVQTADLTTHLEDGQLMLLADARAIMKIYKSFGALDDNTFVKALEQVAKVANGLKGGFLLVRKK